MSQQNEKARLRLILDVRYDLNGEDLAHLERHLSNVAHNAFAEGLITGGSRATVDTWSHSVVDPSEQAIIVKGNLADGFTFVGPFATFDQASDAAPECDTWVAELTDPEAEPAALVELSETQQEFTLKAVTDEAHSNDDFMEQIAVAWISNDPSYHYNYWANYHALCEEEDDGEVRTEDRGT